jgi:ribosomal protein S18 acetylase RimI-like enzyme
MRTILSDFSAQTLVKAIYANWADYYSCLGRSSSAELFDNPYLTYLLTSIPDAFLNVVFRTQLPSQRTDELIDETLAHFRSRNVQRLSWWAEGETSRTELEKHLVSRGLIFNEGGTGMAADLGALPENLHSPAGLKIRPVEDTTALQQWVHITRIGFGIPEKAEGRLFDLFADVAFKDPMQCYLAILNGQPVGTSQFLLSAGVAGIYNVTCLPEARGQGVGAAVTLAPLLEARHRGYRISILQASHLGYPVYRRLGFHDYGKLNIYLWENETKPPAVEGSAA